MLTFEQLLAFRAIIRAGGFGHAADELFLTQPAISQRIRHLEQALGTKLFCRSSSRDPAHLTTAGEHVLKFADEVIARLERLQEDIKGASDSGHRETLTIVSSPSPAKYVLPSLLSAFYEQHPHGRVNVIHCSGGDVNTRVRSGEAELGVRVGRFTDKRFHVIPLLTTRLVLIAAPSHPILRGPQQWLAAARRCPFVAQPVNAYGRQVIDDWAAEVGVEVDIVMETINVDVLKEAVMGGMGLAVISEVAVLEEMGDGRLATVSVPGMPREWQICLIADATRPLSAIGQALLDLAQAGTWRVHVPTPTASDPTPDGSSTTSQQP